MSDTVLRVKEKLSIIEVVQPYVKLTKAGKYWKGLSPFTKEKTPSFFVSPDRGLYHCFSTGKGGDMFTFIEEMEGVDFKGALRMLAEKAGVPIEREDKGARDERDRLYAAIDAAKEFFVHELSGRPNPKGYVTSRGVTEETIQSWSLGYAANEWRALADHLMSKGFTEAELERAGLIKRQEVSAERNSVSEVSKTENREPKSGSRYYDRFRGRIMFPIQDVSGRVIAFSGRIFEDDPVHPQAKYLNSPETALFDKSKAMFGIERARESIRTLNAAILVEGQFDLLMAHQLGFRNAVATSGTAFTEKHAELLSHYSENLLIAYDGDRSGIVAAGRAASIAIPRKMNVKIAKLPPGEDPADLIKRDPALFKQAIKGALHVVDFYLAHIEDAKYDDRTHRLEVSRVVIPYVAMIQNKIDQAHFVKRVAESLKVPEDAVLEEVKKASKASTSPVPQVMSKTEPFLSRADTLERLVFGLYLSFTEGNDAARADKARTVLKEASGDARFTVLGGGSPDDIRAAQFEADFFLERNTDDEMRKAAIDEVYQELMRESYHEQYREALRALRVAEASDDQNRAEVLMQELSLLAPRLK